MKKKISLTLLTVAMTALVAFGVSACKNDKCSHVIVTDQAVSATCQTTGLTQGNHCMKCGEITNPQQPTEKLPHPLVNAVEEVQATCLSEGVKAHSTCSVCEKKIGADGQVLSNVIIPKHSHTLGEQVEGVNPTCDTNGSLAYTPCTACEQKIGTNGEVLESVVIEKLGHTFNVWVPEISATCTKDGTKGYTACSVCKVKADADGEILADLTIEKLGHSYGDWQTKISATCTKFGVLAHKTCANCDKHFNSANEVMTDLTIPTINHRFNAERVSVLTFSKPATETDGATYYVSCDACTAISDKTFISGEAVSDKTLYEAKSITLSLYDLTNLKYGVCFNTVEYPILSVLELTEKGTNNTARYELTSSAYTTKDPGANISSSATDDDTTLNRVANKTVIDLVAGKTYTYKIKDYAAGVETEEFTFTAVDPSKTSFRFSNISDTQNSISDSDSIRSLNTQLSVMNKGDFILHSGDVADKSIYEPYWDSVLDYNREYFGEIPLMAVAGNHDTTGRNDDGYQFDKHFNYNLPTQTSTERGIFYSFDYANVRFINVNTNLLTSNQLQQDQLTWLNNLLNNNPNKWTIVNMHNPLYSAGNYGSDPASNAIALGLQKQLTQLFVDKGVDIVIQGHNHLLQRTYAITGFNTTTNMPTVNQNVATETINGIEHKLNPNGTYYFMNGASSLYGARRPVDGYNAEAYEYIRPDDSSMARLWTEFEVTENTITVVTKQYDSYVEGKIKIMHSWGIKKTA